MPNFITLAQSGLNEKTMTQERRKSDRFDSLNLSCFQVGEDGVTVFEGMGRTLNVSKGGILLEIVSEKVLTGHIVMQIALEDELVDLAGAIVHCNPEESRIYHVGIEFLQMTEKAAIILGKFIEMFEGQEGPLD